MLARADSRCVYRTGLLGIDRVVTIAHKGGPDTAFMNTKEEGGGPRK